MTCIYSAPRQALHLSPPAHGLCWGVYLSLINDDGAMKDDTKFPSGEIGVKLQSALDTVAEDQEVIIRVMCACGQEALTTFETKEL